MKLFNKLVIPAAMIAGLVASAAARQDFSKVIYGNDDRLDYYQASEAQKQLADSTVALFKSYNVSSSGKLTVKNYGAALNLCAEEPFREQVTGAFCSGTLVAPDTIMTAGHCIKDASSCSSTKFVFGFAMKSAGDRPDQVDPSEVYTCKRIVTRDQVDNGPDYAIIKLDRKVPNHKPLEINRSGDIRRGDKIFVIGHPTGLPTKVAGGASVRKVNFNGYFVANLDTYGGNSGSAVFNTKTNLIEGILVRGDNDYVMQSGCRVSNYVSNTGGRGEDVTNVSVVAKFIPRPGETLVEDPEPVSVDPSATPSSSTLGNCVDPGPNATLSQLMAHLDCLTSYINGLTNRQN